MTGVDGPDAAAFGRRIYCDKEARQILKFRCGKIVRDPPDHIDDPGDPTLSDVLRNMVRDDTGRETDIWSLAGLMREGLGFEEAVVWWWYRYAGYDVEKIHHALQGADGDVNPDHRRNSVRNITRTLESAASKLPDQDPGDVPDLTDVCDFEPAPAQG